MRRGGWAKAPVGTLYLNVELWYTYITVMHCVVRPVVKTLVIPQYIWFRDMI